MKKRTGTPRAFTAAVAIALTLSCAPIAFAEGDGPLPGIDLPDSVNDIPVESPQDQEGDKTPSVEEEDGLLPEEGEPMEEETSDSMEDPQEEANESEEEVTDDGISLLADITLDPTTTNWTNGNTYIASGNVTISDRVTVTGTVILQLDSGCTLTVSQGITVANSNRLTIQGSGTLNAYPNVPDNMAAIGGGNTTSTHDAGYITINGGTITASGGDAAAGIGGGNGGTGGKITINGGTVDAYGGDGVGGTGGGAGIGGGQGASNDTTVIHGGTIIARGYDGGAGIGGGYGGGGYRITINGGDITAMGGADGAGIGGGNSVQGGTITITNGTITASSNAGAGIGGGRGARGGIITISGGTVASTSTSASGIGSGYGYAGAPSTDNVFGTESTGHAFITTNSISDKSSQAAWHGVIFEGTSGQLYGSSANSSVTLSRNATIPAGYTLSIPTDRTLTVGSGTTLTNNGTINDDGTIIINGALTNNGTLNLETGATCDKAPSGSGVITATGSEIKLSATVDGQAVSSAPYESAVTLVADVSAVGIPVGAANGTVNFYVAKNGIDNARKLNATPIPVNNGQATYALDLDGDDWEVSSTPYPILAEYIAASGSNVRIPSNYLTEESSVMNLRVTEKDTEPEPDTPDPKPETPDNPQDPDTPGSVEEGTDQSDDGSSGSSKSTEKADFSQTGDPLQSALLTLLILGCSGVFLMRLSSSNLATASTVRAKHAKRPSVRK